MMIPRQELFQTMLLIFKFSLRIVSFMLLVAGLHRRCFETRQNTPKVPSEV